MDGEKGFLRSEGHNMLPLYSHPIHDLEPIRVENF